MAHDPAIQAADRFRRVAATVPVLLMASAAVAKTRYIYTASHMLALDAQTGDGLVPLRAPIDLPGLLVSVMWHE